MIEVEEAKRLVLESGQKLAPAECALMDSLGLVLAEDVVSELDIPPFDNSAMDGFALLASDTVAATESVPAVLRITETVQAGKVPRQTVIPGTAVKIMTGAPVPSGADAVIQVEQTRETDGKVHILRPVKPGENIRRAGEDLTKGTVALAAGTLIRPAEIGLLASLGNARVKIYPRPRVAILSTGEELVEIDEPMVPGKIRNSNTYSLIAQVLTCGAEPVSLGIARDTVEDTIAKVKEGLNCDVLLTTGGVSVGEYDFVKEVLEELGAELKFWSVAQKPGKPLAFWLIESKPVFGLPGNPVATMVCFEEYVRPLLLKMMGKTRLFRPEVEAVLVNDLKKKPGRVHFVRVVVEQKEGVFYATSTGPQGSGILSSMSQANGLALIPKDVTQIKAGEKVKVHLIDMPEDH